MTDDAVPGLKEEYREQRAQRDTEADPECGCGPDGQTAVD